MNKIIETIFYPYTQNILSLAPQSEGEGNGKSEVAFLNAAYNPALETWRDQASLTLQQYFKPCADILQSHGFDVTADMPDHLERYDTVLLHSPKNMVEARGLMAQALTMLKPCGTIICGAHNKAGGTRLKKMLAAFGLENIQDISKNKARVVWAKKSALALAQAPLEEARKAAAMQPVLEGRFISQSGIFGWDKIDRGSQILCDVLPDSLTGHGADFGCGYGFLSDYLLRNDKGIKSLICIDADHRAIEAARINLDPLARAANIDMQYIWGDLTSPKTLQQDSAGQKLDWIIMNPPFHEGKKTAPEIGIAFIKNAARALKKEGQLWMVANTGLPYEQILERDFSRIEKITQRDGFKVFCAWK